MGREANIRHDHRIIGSPDVGHVQVLNEGLKEGVANHRSDSLLLPL